MANILEILAHFVEVNPGKNDTVAGDLPAQPNFAQSRQPDVIEINSPIKRK